MSETVPTFDPGIFRMYDIRGKAGSQISSELAYHVGLVIGTRIRRSGGSTAAVGHDVRHSSPGLAQRAAEGLADTGIQVSFLGQAPTPVVYHALHRLELDGGIIVTGSHNPRDDNGLKICLGTATIWGDAVSSIRTQIEERDFVLADASTGASIIRDVDYVPRYLDELCERFRFDRPANVSIDTGNGVMGPLVLEILERLGFTVEPLFTEPDGDFPNHLPDPEVPAYMAELSKRTVASNSICGLGFDGDGDRVGVLDEQGRKISADWLIALFAADLLKSNPGGKVRYDVKCSNFLADHIRRHGGEPVMGETGHSLLKRDIKEIDAIFGGELSGHLVFNRGYVPIDDSLYCALYFLEMLERSGGPASALFQDLPELVSTAEIKVPCADERKFDVVDRIVESFRGPGNENYEVIDIDGVRVTLPGGAWFLIRASNTTPCLTVRLEAASEPELENARSLVNERLARFDLNPIAP